MYICLCQAITEDQIKKAAGHSANTEEALKKLGVGESCGVCLIEALSKFGLSTPHTSKNESPPHIQNQKPSK